MTSQNSTSQPQVNPTSNEQETLALASSNLGERQPPPKLSNSNLKTKIIASAIALSVVPIAFIGTVAYKTTHNQISQQIDRMQQERIHHLSSMFEKFIINHIHEAQTLAANPIFTNPNVLKTVTLNQKKSALDTFQDQTGFYDSIVYLDLAGNPQFQSQSEYPLKRNYGDRAYFQQAIKNKQTTLNKIGISSLTGKPRIEFAVPVKDAWTDRVIGVLRFRIPSQESLPIFQNYVTANEQWHLINSEGTIFASSLDNLNNRPLANYFPEIQQAHSSQQIVSKMVDSPMDGDRQQLINYAPVNIEPAYGDLNLGTAISLDTDFAFAPLQFLKWIYLGGTIGTALLVGSLAVFFANHIIKPLQKIISTVDELSQGKLSTRVELNRRDEFSVLGNGINEMAQQLDITVQRQQTIATTSQLMAKISQARSLRELQRPFSEFLAEVRKFLKADRVVFYQFNRQWFGTVVAESVARDFPRTLGVQFDDPCFAQEYVRKYQRGRIQAISDIYEANLTECYLQQLETYQVRASLVLPVMLERSLAPEAERLVGLLIAHQCSDPRVWQQSDIDYCQQTASQLSTILKGYVGTQEENWQKAELQKDLSGVLERMQNVARGDLRKQLDADNHNSDVIESFNSAIAELEQTVTQIKAPSQQINKRLRTDRDRITELKDRLKQQTNQLALVFAFMEQLTGLVSEIDERVDTASVAVNLVAGKLESEKANFNQAIGFMSELDNSLRQNTDKVKNLSRASQKMSKMIGSIRKINLRASLLASKLGKRIPELDESAYGLKEEIKSIQQSIAATKELENIVRGIDLEIAQVLQEYQAKEDRLERENYLVVNANYNLEKIVQTTRNTQQQLLSLVNMTKMQLQTSQKINSLQDQIDRNSASMSDLSERAIDSLQETSLTAQDLENVINFFKLESSSD